MDKDKKEIAPSSDIEAESAYYEQNSVTSDLASGKAKRLPKDDPRIVMGKEAARAELERRKREQVESERKIIPPPPTENALNEEIAAYFEKYSIDDLVQAGYVKPAPGLTPGLGKVQAAAREELAKRKRPQENSEE